MDVTVCPEKERKSMTKAKVSIIVPFHNTEKYIGTCLKSLTEQTYSDIEIICINDGSTDNSRAIVEEFQQEDKRIHLLNQKNAGSCISRKQGLSVASGKYIMFCDSDDYYEPEMVATMVECMETHADVDLATCGSFTHHISGAKRNLESYLRHKRHGISDLTQTMKYKETVLLWNKIFRKELWDKYDIKACDELRGDDDNLVFKYLSVSKKIYHIKKEFYNHIIRKDSLMGSVNKISYVNQTLVHLDDIADFLDTNELWSANADFYAKKLLYLINQLDPKDLDARQDSELYFKILHLARRIKNQNIIDAQIKNAVYAIQNGNINGSHLKLYLDIQQTEKSIPIVFACDDNYVKYLTVTLQSVIENASQNHIYHIIILDCGITSKALDIIQRQIAQHTNFTLDIVSASAFLEERKNSFKAKGRFTTAIYGRLLIPEICSTFDKVIYADVDIIFNRDIAELMAIDLKKNYIAGVIELSMEAMFEYTKKYLYTRNELRTNTKSYYINSGLMVFNLKEWNKNAVTNTCIDILEEHLTESSWPDQDAINLACKNKIHYLDQLWNCCPFIERRLRDEDVIKSVEKDRFIEKLCSQYVVALNNPDTVFHYATPQKPWNTPFLKHAEKWWAYCKKTEFYEQILFQNTSRQIQNHLIDFKTSDSNNSFQRQAMETGNYTRIIKNYYLLGLSILKTKTTAESKKYYLFGIRFAKTVKNLHKKKYYFLGLRVFTLKVWKN